MLKEPPKFFAPQPGKQTQFLSSSADITGYGGAAGSGKTYAVLLAASRYIDKPNYKATIFRRTYPEIRAPGGLFDVASSIFPLVGGARHDGANLFRWKNGAEIRFSHMQHEGDVYSWQGSALPIIIFDELTHFSRTMFFYMLSRNRLSHDIGIRPAMMFTTNPDASSWVADLISWYIDQSTGLPIEERSGVLRYFIRDGDALRWANDPSDFGEHADDAKSFTYVSAKLTDNPALMKNDPDYLKNLKAMSLVERARLYDGNWKILPSSGMVFRREWFSVVDAAPAMTQPDVRYWDRASTEAGPGAANPDWSVGVRIRYTKGRFYVLDVCRMRGRPAAVKAAMRNCADQDGDECIVCAEQDPAQAGVSEIDELSRLFQNRIFKSRRVTTRKALRARIASAQAEQGNISIVRGAWNEEFLAELQSFADWDVLDTKQPSQQKDDQVDGFTGGVNFLTEPDDQPRVRQL